MSHTVHAPGQCRGARECLECASVRAALAQGTFGHRVYQPGERVSVSYPTETGGVTVGGCRVLRQWTAGEYEVEVPQMLGDAAPQRMVVRHDQIEPTGLGDVYMEVDRYLSKPLRQFHQLDGWANLGHGDDIMVPDDEGDVLMCGGGADRQISGTTVRIMVDPEAKREDVLRVLRKLTNWYETEDNGAIFSPLAADVGGRLSDECIAEVRRATSLVELVLEYGVELKPAGAGGRRFKGLCPFHAEDTPSFAVSSEKGMFWCSGCGVGGDAVSFLMETAKVGFVEAIERLAERSGTDLRYLTPDQLQPVAASDPF